MRKPGYLIVYLAVVTFIFIISLLRADTLDEGVRTFVDLLFIVGGTITAVGAFFYTGWGSRLSSREWHAHSTGNGKESEDQVEIFLKYRKMQRRRGIIAIIFGLALIGLSVVIVVIGNFYSYL